MSSQGASAPGAWLQCCGGRDGATVIVVGSTPELLQCVLISRVPRVPGLMLGLVPIPSWASKPLIWYWGSGETSKLQK